MTGSEVCFVLIAMMRYAAEICGYSYVHGDDGTGNFHYVYGGDVIDNFRYIHCSDVNDSFRYIFAILIAMI
jgi:hypothetical protein